MSFSSLGSVGVAVALGTAALLDEEELLEPVKRFAQLRGGGGCLKLPPLSGARDAGALGS